AASLVALEVGAGNSLAVTEIGLDITGASGTYTGTGVVVMGEVTVIVVAAAVGFVVAGVVECVVFGSGVVVETI
ncbi:unnamed protein product, partial [Allacma fusca]